MKKKFISICIFLIINVFVFADVRDLVCIVHPNYSDALSENLNSFIPYLDKLEIEDSKQYIADFIEKGVSGSGFVYIGPDGKNYIITNRHVIRDASTSTIIFENAKTKSKTTINGMKILASDAELDLAILEFPSDKQIFTTGLIFSNADVSDGDTVFTAGYPGLISKPVWQFGTGIITNSSVEAEEMIKPELSSLIQHSAQIDGGNSGGPLLIKNKKGDYEVIGINTWKITNRQDTNFAIPSVTIKKFIDDALKGKKTIPENSQNIIAEKAAKLNKILNKNNVTFAELAEYISIDFVEHEGKEIFDIVINKCSKDNKETINNILTNYSPIEGMRYTIGWYLFNEFHRGEQEKKSIKDLKNKNDNLPELDPPEKVNDTDYWNTSIINKKTNKPLELTWTYINGAWEIWSTKNPSETNETYSTKNRIKQKLNNEKEKKEIVEEKKEKKEKKAKEQIVIVPEGKGFKVKNKVMYLPFHAEISYGKNFLSSQNPQGLWSNTIDVNIKIKDYVSAVVYYELIEESIYIYKQHEPIPQADIRYHAPYTGIRFQLPMVNRASIFMPYSALLAGVEFYKAETDFVCKGKLGSRLFFVAKKNQLSLFADVNLNYKFNFADFNKNDIALNLSGGFTF